MPWHPVEAAGPDLLDDAPFDFGQAVNRHVAEFGQLFLRHASSVALRGDIFSEVVVHLTVSNPLVLPPE